jgi:hypothetical protein
MSRTREGKEERNPMEKCFQEEPTPTLKKSFILLLYSPLHRRLIRLSFVYLFWSFA